MKTTLDLPENLVATLEATAAREHRDVSDVAREALARGLPEKAATASTEPPGTVEERRRAMEEWLKEWRALGTEITAKSVDPRSMVELLREGRE